MILPPEEQERRRRSVQRTFDDLRLDGLRPSHEARVDAEDYISGRRTLDELIERVVQRHARS
ncbi:antitoxin VbhA family protein [Microbacterium sp. C5A9]|uniref:antitoxin VbhA family protein n=1 Tax=Microbacterium sp. C5A9 TaxID=2736663 RepID=UPI0035ABE941|nr:antitoxin VbhA family protein [Microbacterium sp. C5A9]